MSDEAYWADLRPILQDMAERIARIEQFLAASGLQAPSAFSVPPGLSTPGQMAAAPAGISPFGGPTPGVLPEDILFLARSGKQIQAIKELRKRTGVSLKLAKDIIDQAIR